MEPQHLNLVEFYLDMSNKELRGGHPKRNTRGLFPKVEETLHLRGLWNNEMGEKQAKTILTYKDEILKQ